MSRMMFLVFVFLGCFLVLGFAKFIAWTVKYSFCIFGFCVGLEFSEILVN